MVTVACQRKHYPMLSGREPLKFDSAIGARDPYGLAIDVNQRPSWNGLNHKDRNRQDLIILPNHSSLRPGARREQGRAITRAMRKVRRVS